MDYRMVAKKFAEDVRKSLGDLVKEVILFGSVARGEYRSDSDIDILIVVDADPWEIQKRVSDLVVEYLLKYGAYISAKVVSTEEFELMRGINTAFYTNVRREGVSLG
ncbi:nucleotidyltransferase domain-containing protein [Thermococcus stetteri]|uniref:nucleotidyltransferase domain-containing protein n=1 Tax=Thermococcus stetteri TaxID=49900 RepID=UPI001AE5FD11|nr:nucleotidyltransferase domain-containing protein [Thermococcus stetteri]MBP1912274.1 putative nucleotidyltransferase [Thermococcus stetteri]